MKTANIAKSASSADVSSTTANLNQAAKPKRSRKPKVTENVILPVVDTPPAPEATQPVVDTPQVDTPPATPEQKIMDDLRRAIALGEAIKLAENAKLRADCRKVANTIITSITRTPYLSRAIMAHWIKASSPEKAGKARTNVAYRAQTCTPELLSALCAVDGVNYVLLADIDAVGEKAVANIAAWQESAQALLLTPDARNARALSMAGNVREQVADAQLAISKGLVQAFGLSIDMLRKSGGWNLPAELSSLVPALAVGGALKYRHFAD